MSDDKKKSSGSSRTPRITRTHSVMPASSSTRADPATSTYVDADGRKRYATPGPERRRNGSLTGRYIQPDGRITWGKDGEEVGNVDPRKYTPPDRSERPSRLNYAQMVEQSRQHSVTVDGAAVDPADRHKSVQESLGRTVADDGTVTWTGADGKTVTDTVSYAARVAKAQGAASSTFGALNMADISPSAQFVMSYGAANAVDPLTSGRQHSGNQDLRAGARNASQRTDAERNAANPSQNMMTIAGGVQWFKKLSVTDPGAYNQLVVQLRNAGYLNGKDEDLPLGGYSRVAAEAFAMATSDLAQSNNAGDTRSLPDWLTARGQGFLDAAAEQDVYKPVDRTFEDPAAVAAAAKEAAIKALGRKLTDAEEARFETAFRGKENAFYDQIDAAGRAKTAAQVAQPNLSGQVDAFIDAPQYDTERGAKLIGDYASSFMQMMGAGR